MYKATQENSDYLDRVANHSTKGSRRGFADVGSVDSRLFQEDPEVIRRRLNDAKKILIEERLEIEKSIVHLRDNIKNWRKNVAYKYKGKEHLFSDKPAVRDQLRYYFALGDQLQTIDKQFREICTYKKQEMPSLFMDKARDMLPEDLFEEIKQAAYDELSTPNKNPLESNDASG